MITVWARRAAKHDLSSTKIRPDYTVSNFEELRTILREDFGIALS